MADFTGQVVIVTGGAQGIGGGISRAFAGAGAQVAVLDIDAEAGAALAEEEGQIRFFEADVASDAVCAQTVGQIIEDWGRVDVLCNNVGIQPVPSYKLAHELPIEMWDRIIDVNLKSFFLMARHCLPQMMDQGKGVIINTASVQGLQSASMVSAYAASKGGIISMTRQLALDYAKYGIRVLAVNPGGIQTPLVDEVIEAFGHEREQFFEDYAKLHPIGRYGQPEDIANAMLFLASDKASFMTGENVCVDGGLMAKGAWAEVEE
ncbi:MAG: SDR family oxidoreductase [Gemmatimonadetes bacterium]|nr:SDR family oxidoreductase [Gemmatimonadota bacterium]